MDTPGPGRRIGYTRTSTTGQDTVLQRDALRRDGCERIVVEVVSGARADRPILEECLAELAAGDTLVVWRLDRLGRSAQHLLGILERLRDRGVAFRSATEGMDTSTYMGRFVFTILGAVAEMEREIIRERVNAGLVAARQRGRVGGRPPVVTPERLCLAPDGCAPTGRACRPSPASSASGAPHCMRHSNDPKPRPKLP